MRYFHVVFLCIIACRLKAVSTLQVTKFEGTTQRNEGASPAVVPWPPVFDSMDPLTMSNTTLIGQIPGVVQHVLPLTLEQIKSKTLVLFLGCSVDFHILQAACAKPEAGYIGATELACSYNDLVLMYAFHPGATPPPYYDALNHPSSLTSHDIVNLRLKSIFLNFGRLPDVVIVDSSMWDVANWWGKDGSPKVWPVPATAGLKSPPGWLASSMAKHVDPWCHETVPNFLKFVQTAVPNGVVLSRLPFPVFDDDYQPYAAHLHETINMMTSCLRKAPNTWTLDTPTMVNTAAKRIGGSYLTPDILRKLYSDNLHPGPKLSLGILDQITSWVKSLPVYQELKGKREVFSR